MKTLLLIKFIILVTGFVVMAMPTTSICSESSNVKMVMRRSVMCETIVNFQPVNPAVVFSISLGEVFCFSDFYPVNEETVIYHNWYKKDKLIFTMKLTLFPPKWSSFSRIQIRDADKGPWRVEVRDVDDVLLKCLQFSMVD